MIGAYLLVNTNGKDDEGVLEVLKKMDEVTNAHIVTGLHDIIVFLEEENMEKLSETMINKIRKTDGIVKTVTCIAVK